MEVFKYDDGMGHGCRGVTTKNQVPLRDCVHRYPRTKEEKALEGSVQERRFSLPQKSLPAFICGTSTMTRHQNSLDPEMPLLTFLFPNSESVIIMWAGGRPLSKANRG